MRERMKVFTALKGIKNNRDKIRVKVMEVLADAAGMLARQPTSLRIRWLRRCSERSPWRLPWTLSLHATACLRTLPRTP